VKLYITTPIYYPNDRPHLGHAYTTVLADIVARWFRLIGYEVFFLTGTDEHGLKLQREAEKRGLTPKQFVDSMAEVFKDYWRLLNIEYSRFIRTTDADHEELVKRALTKLYQDGYVYKGKYSGWYCASCEKYYTEKEYEIVDGKPTCPIHKKPLEFVEEETYFLRLSAFTDYIIKVLSENNVVYPEAYAQEVLSKIKTEGLQDLSIARPKSRVYWGIELPFDREYTVYVWIDALLNYLTGAGFGTDTKRFEELWKSSIQFIGKDILWFHTAVWFSVLAMLGVKPPSKLVVHAFLTVKGTKMGKSVGNVVQIEEVVNRYSNPEALRYLVARLVNYNKDIEVTWELLDSIYTGDLVNNYGNLVRRVTALAIKSLNGSVERSIDPEFASIAKKLVAKAVDSYNRLELSEAVNAVMELAREANAYLNRREPWREEKPVTTIYSALEGVRLMTLLLHPVMPSTTKSILDSIGVKILTGLEQFEFGYQDRFVVTSSPIPFRKLSPQ